MLRLAAALLLSSIGYHAFLASLPVALVAAGRSDAEIGALMGLAPLMQIGAGLLAGGLIDRYGGRLVFLAGSVAFGVAAAALATGLASSTGPTWALVVIRLLQGVGFAVGGPAVYSLVPGTVEPRRLATALSIAAMAGNLSFAISPPLSLALLGAASLELVAAVALVAVVASMVLAWPLPSPAPRGPAGRPSGARLLRPAWRSAWLAPLAILVLFLVHWGILTGYLPQRAATAGADVGLFFTADAVAIVALRVPAARLMERAGSRPLVVSAVVVTLVALALLLLPPTTPLLVLAGLGTGTSGALCLPPIMVELSLRSSAADRGSAFAFFSVAFAAGSAIGSIGLAPFIDAVGWAVAIGLGMAALVAAAGIALVDPSLRGRPVVGADPAAGTAAP